MRLSLLRLLLPILLGAIATCASAAPATPAERPGDSEGSAADIPGALKDWRGWVLHGSEYRACPFIATQPPGDASAFLCAWPGKLTIAADEHGATLVQHWHVDIAGWIPLPGDAQNWPQDFSADGQHLPLLEREGLPMVWLASGNHELRAHIPWSERPQSLPVPDSVALIELSVDGKPVPAPQRDGNGVALGRSAGTTTEADSLTVQVFRLLEDELPAELTTRLALTVGGSAREIDLGVPLGGDFAPLALSGDLPARLDAAAHLHVQLRPGHWVLNLRARALAPLQSVSVPAVAEPWPAQEIWSYAAHPELRVSNPVAATPIDPGQADVPTEWRMLPAFALGAGNVLKIEERSRGLAPDEANRLQLTREAWLDFSGSGFSTRDTLRGTLVRDWRLDVAAPYLLRRAEAQVRGNHEGLLITRGSSAERSGVEWSRAMVDLSASTHVARDGLSLPVTGWQQSLDAVALTLHLPYGYRLLGAPGADAVSGSWASRWRLLDAFLVALLALLAWRLLGLLGGIAVALYLLFGYQESGAPFWTLTAVLIFALIQRALPAGRLQRSAGLLARSTAVVLLLVALPFAADQVRSALYPQLERSPDQFSGGALGNYGGLYRHRASNALYDARKDARDEQALDAPEPVADAMPSPAAPPPPMAMKVAPKPVSRAKLETTDVSAGMASSNGPHLNADGLASRVMQRYAENTVVQSGGGEPAWHYGSTAQLNWSGPVLPTQTVQLLILPPIATRLLRLVLVGLLGWLMLRLLQRAFGTPGNDGGRTPALRRGAGAGGVMGTMGARSGAALLLLAMTASPPAQAQAPDANILNELRNRLTAPPHCVPDCARIANASVLAQGERIRITLEAHTGERVALPVPSSTHGLVLRSITLDGAVQDSLLQHEDKWWLLVGRGVHRIELEFDALQNDKIALDFPLPPAQVQVTAQGWVASGVSDGRLLTEALELVRLRAGSDTGAASGNGEQQFAPFVRLTRDISLDLDWSIANSVQRLAPASGGFSVELPLLANETVQTAQLKVHDQHITVPLPSNGANAAWQSRLARSDSFTLTAPALTAHAEIWKITLSPTWHAEFSGLPETSTGNQSAADYWTHEFHPLPGETLTVKVTRPEAIAGDSLALDAVTLDSTIALHAAEHQLSLSLRSTRGGEHVIALPDGAQVLGVDKDGQSQNLRPREGKLSLPITPGAQRFTVRWRDSSELGWSSAMPALNVHLAAANLQLALNLPADRWVLWTYGPSTGPAVLYWGELLLMLVLAYALTRLRRAPLSYWQWLLLGLGFSTFSWSALVVVVAWLLALQWRQQRVAPAGTLRFNLTQLGLAGLSVAALLALVTAIPYGLLGAPDMHVAGNGSTAHALRWFSDASSDGELPRAGAITLPLWAYKVAMLAWALWLANALIGWLRWGFAAYAQGGYWRAPTPKVAATTGTAPADTTLGEAGR